MKKKKRFSLGQTLLHLVFICICVCYLIPFLYMISISLSSQEELIVNGYHMFPQRITFDNFRLALNQPTQILQAYLITFLSASVGTALSVLVMGVMAYPLSRPNYRWRNPITFIVFFTMLFSGGLVPSYILNVKYLHLGNSFWVYVMPSLVNAWHIIIIRTNYRQLPDSMIEATKIDGASEIRICLQFVMPLSLPAIATVAFLLFVNRWNDWMTSMIYIRKQSLYTLQYLLQRVLQDAEYMRQLAENGDLGAADYVFPTEGFRFALAIIAAGPVLIVFPFFQKYFSRGLTVGAVKG